jgi:hypothetical protein
LVTVPTWPVASISIVAGFAVAEATGVRALGGAVLALALAWCALRWRRDVGTGRAAALAGLYLAGFAGAHVLADVIGSWPAVLVVAAAIGLACWLAADAVEPRRRRA